ncbi:hypothetical protein GWI33_017548 [Rhynchophorus ferrugineus]|uniref:Uncharacterized protein n=1 Tax=Rhynchophorus ferrugineus TaxID=354439 RepID=A0A834M924_RHYFE|nr:hypothetical protein GWI33_017548 [Rhynchophorus ferrugineus]
MDIIRRDLEIDQMERDKRRISIVYFKEIDNSDDWTLGECGDDSDKSKGKYDFFNDNEFNKIKAMRKHHKLETFES